MASGYGRGGRGAALLEALKARKPGESPSTASETSSSSARTPSVPTAQPVGRGAMMAQMMAQQQKQPSPPGGTPMGRGQVLQQATGSVPAQPTVARGRSALLASVGMKQDPARPVGRGALAMQLKTPSSPGTPAISPPMQQVQQQQQQQQPTPPSSVSSPQPAPSPQHPPTGEQPAQGDARMSNLEYMLHRMELDKEVVSKSGKKGTQIPLKGNYIYIKCKNKGVYQYAVSFSPSVDSKSLRFRFMNEHTATLGEVRAFDGAILFLPIKLQDDPTILTSIRPTDEQQISIQVKLTRVLPPEACVQLYNVVFRRAMYELKLCQVGRHHYDPNSPAPVPQHKLEVWPGYITAVAQYEGGLMMLVDVSHRVLRTETILDLMADAARQSPRDFQKIVTDKILGKTVLTRYNNKTYGIDDILWDKNPTEEFETGPGTTISFVEYYKKHYNKEVKDLQQPLLLHRPKAKDKERRGKKALDVICLIPEFCFITGLTDEIRQDFRIMKDLACHTRISPGQRQQSLRKFCENINSHPEARRELEKWGLQLDLDTVQIMGRKLPEEEISFKTGRPQLAGPRADWGNRLGRDQVITSIDIENWIVVYTQRNANNVRDFIQSMQQECPSMGWKVARPLTLELPNDRTESYLNAIRQNLSSRVQVVVAIFPTSRDDRYNAFKKLCCVESPVPSQVINDKTISKKPKLRSVVQKIGLQINCKLGGELWAVKIPSKGLMVCGIDTYHAPGNKRNSVGGFVASINATCTRWYSRVCQQSPGQELIDGLKMCLMAAIRKWYEVNHELPARIVVYRDGVGDGQLPVVAGHEVRQLSSCFQTFGENYKPKLGVVVVQKRINTRLFAIQGQGRNSKLDNPPPGTVMDHSLTRRDLFDFFLVSQHVTQGTVTPTHYVVVHDELEWSVDNIQALSYKLTHLYYNWPGTVRVPAPCQYAHKLAYLVGQNIHKEPALELSDRLFFL